MTFPWKPNLPVTDQAARTNLNALSSWIQNLGYIKPQTYSHSIDNGTSTAYAVYGSASSLLSRGVPYNLRMYVEATGECGNSGANNLLNLQIRTSAGTNITLIEAYGGATALFINQTTPLYQQHHMIGYADFLEGAPATDVGYQLVYKVSASNTYLRTGVKVTFVPNFT